LTRDNGVWSTVGSTNLDWRSFLNNLEINAVILGPDFGNRMKALFEQDLQSSKQITLEDWKNRPLLLHLKESGARLWAHALDITRKERRGIRSNYRFRETWRSDKGRVGLLKILYFSMVAFKKFTFFQSRNRKLVAKPPRNQLGADRHLVRDHAKLDNKRNK
jgi:hypothetical protein